MPASRATLSTGRKALIGAIATTLALLLVEIVCRVALSIAPQPPNERMASAASVFVHIAGLTRADVDELFQPDPFLFWRIRPSVHGLPWRPPLWIDCRSNGLGLRDDECSRARPRDAYRVLALGDSCTYGSGVLMADSYPNRLEVRLNFARQQRRNEVLNAGCPGYTLFQGLTFLRSDGFALQPQLVTVAFGFNDRNTWGALSDAEFSARQNTPLARLGRALERLATVRAMRFGLATVQAAPVEGPINGTRPRVPADEFEQLLGVLVNECRARAIPVVILLWPLRPQIEGDGSRGSQPTDERHAWQAAMQAVAERDHVPLLDLITRLRAETGLFIDNCHMTTKGCDRVADELFKLLTAEHLADPR
ncbi:MAG: SGNH/GDSL hydrolase family protein [Planctomycetota bacterium]